MKPHHDNVNGADAAIVVGLSDASDFSGALLFVSTTKRGKVWYDNVTFLQQFNGCCIHTGNS